MCYTSMAPPARIRGDRERSAGATTPSLPDSMPPEEAEFRRGRERGAVRRPGAGPVLPVRARCGIYMYGGARCARPLPPRKEAPEMPTYSFECKKCGKKFQEILSFREFEEGKRKCPKCGSRNVA